MYVCNDCPRKCNASREDFAGSGFCGCGTLIPVAKVMTHMWEEPCLAGTEETYNGTENIFLYGCNLKCIFCQNAKINGTSKNYDKSHLSFLSPEEFGKLLLSASKTKANNIGIVSGDHFIRQIAEGITDEIKAQLNKPVIFNCNGYEKVESLSLLAGKIDIFMPDFKYADKVSASSYSYAEDYPEIAVKAIKKMVETVGPAKFDKNGLMTSGVIIRHLIMPGKIANTLRVIDFVNENFMPGEVVFSLMSQYTPIKTDFKYKELTRSITSQEKHKAVSYLESCENITLAYTQEDGVVSESFIPDF